jgi:hypothetical protein
MAEPGFQYSTPLWQRGLILARRRRQWPLKLARTIRSTKSQSHWYQNTALQGNIYLVGSFNPSLCIRKEFRPFISKYQTFQPVSQRDHFPTREGFGIARWPNQGAEVGNGEKINACLI